jgi:cobalt-zinc-cadmium efflux system outer membrane protein
MRQLIIYILLVLSSETFADELRIVNNLTLDQAIANVLERSPILKAAGYEEKEAAARIRSAQLSPGYRTSIEIVSKVLELGDKAKFRGDVAQNKALILRNEQDAKRLDLLADTTKKFIHIVTDQERLIIAKDSLTLAKHTQKVVEQRVQAGKTPSAELRRAKIALARSELELDHAKHELATSRIKLTALWGETQETSITADADLFAIQDTTPFYELSTLLERNPNLVRFATENRLSISRAQLARSGGSADIEIKGGLRHFNATDDTGLVLSLNIPLGSSSRASSRVEEAEMMRLRDPHLYEQRRLELYTTLFEVHQEIKHSIDAVKTLRNTIIPQAKHALQDYEKGYAAGRYSFSELSLAQSLLLESRLEAVMAAADYHRYRIEIDRLTGAGLSTGANP